MSHKADEPVDRITAWQCIGCGKIDSPQECIGVCTNHKVCFVHEADYLELEQELGTARANLAALTTFVRSLAATTPRNGQWERCYRSLQATARALMQDLPGT